MLTDHWATSSYSLTRNCVQVRQDSTVDVRDSKNPGPVLSVSPATWQAFLSTIKSQHT